MPMPKYSYEQFSAVRNYADVCFSPDGKWVAYITNASGQMNLWKQRVQLARGEPFAPIQLTAFTEQVARGCAFSPKGKRIFINADFQGNERHQIYEVPADNGWHYPVVENPEKRFMLGTEPFSPDGKLIAYSSDERSPKDLDAIIFDLKKRKPRTVLSGDANFFPHSFSPDGRFLLVTRLNSNADSDIFLCDVSNGEARHLTKHEGEIIYLPVGFSPDGNGFYLLTDKDREFWGLAFYSFSDSTLTYLKTPDWNIESAEVSKDGRYIAYILNEEGYSRLFVLDKNTGQEKSFDSLPRGVYSILRFSPKSSQVALYISRFARPAELYIVNIETGKFWKLTQSYLGGVPEEEMVEPELVRYKTHDGRMVPGFLYKPREASPANKSPVVLSIHGGPEAQERVGYAYNGFYQYLLNRGIGIFAPNVRGSTGYGKSYQKLIHRDWGGAELKDFEFAARYLQSLSWVDSSRLGVFGGSFGGFATLSCVTRLPDYWKAAVDIVGPSNLITFTKSVPEFWKRYMKEWVGDPDEDAEMLKARSPINYVDNIKAPILIIQGANDPRVVKAESDQMVGRLRELGRTVEYMVFEDEGHGFTKPANYLKALKASALFLENHLLKE